MNNNNNPKVKFSSLKWIKLDSLTHFIFCNMNMSHLVLVFKQESGERSAFSQLLFLPRGESLPGRARSSAPGFGPPPPGSVVLLPQGGHHHGQELLEGCLDLRGEAGTHLGGDDDGQAVSQQLREEHATDQRLPARWVCREPPERRVLPWSCPGRRAASRSAARSARRRWSWCHPCSWRRGPGRAEPWFRGPGCSGWSWWRQHCRGYRSWRSTSESRGRRSDTWGQRGGERVRKAGRTEPDRTGPVPDESLGAHIVIVQVGEDGGDDAALLIGPGYHGGCCRLSSASGLKEKRWLDPQAEPGPFNGPAVPHALRRRPLIGWR